jgi:hypothetical protein
MLNQSKLEHSKPFERNYYLVISAPPFLGISASPLLPAMKMRTENEHLQCTAPFSLVGGKPRFMTANDRRLSGRPRMQPGCDELVGGRSAPTAG